jgi:hypothetical protein
MSSDSGEINQDAALLIEAQAENERLKNEIEWLRSVIENLLDNSQRK